MTEDLKKFDIPTLIVHSDDDQIIPIGASALHSTRLVKNCAGASHGLAHTQLNTDLLAFLNT